MNPNNKFEKYAPIIESILFVCGDEGININKLMEIININKATYNKSIILLKNKYDQNNSAIFIKEFNNKIKLSTKASFDEFIRKVTNSSKIINLSKSVIEVASIILINHPITKPKIEYIRGISSDAPILKLLSYELIKRVGRDSIPGRPILYSPTEKAYDVFDISNISNLRNKFDSLNSTEENNLFN